VEVAEAHDSRDDDGHGMMHDDALLAFERHATSKLKSADDLLSISTLGFVLKRCDDCRGLTLVLESADAQAKTKARD